MSLSENENQLTMNLMIISKRKETEKHIVAEHSKLAARLDSLKLSRQDDFTVNNKLQEESAILNHQNAILSSKINNYISESNRIQKELVMMECKIDELKSNHSQVSIVKDKEDLTTNLLFERMSLHQKKLNKLWERENDPVTIKNLELKKKSLKAKQTQLQSNIQQIQMKTGEKKKSKINEEIMILKKRNAAYLKRMNKKLEHLELSLHEKKKTAHPNRWSINI